MMAWKMAVNMNAHVQRVFGIYILGARRTGGGSVVGKPSRWWYPPGWVSKAACGGYVGW